MVLSVKGMLKYTFPSLCSDSADWCNYLRVDNNSFYFSKNLSMNFPDQLLYTKDHEWIRMDTDYAYVGITDFAQHELGDIVFVDIAVDGKEIKKGEVFGTVEAVKTVSDLFMPVSGIIEEVNETLNEQPDMVNISPYDKGWMVKIKLTESPHADELLSADDYKNLVS